VRAASAGSISVQWDPNTETDVVGYRVFIGTQPGVYSSSVDVGNTTSYVFNSALDGQQYCFAVAAYAAGPRLGDKSVEVCHDTTGNQPNFAAFQGQLLTLRDEGSRLPAAAVALSPWTDLALTGPSLRLNADADAMIRSEEAPRLARYYLAGADPRTPYASPLYGDPTGLPPTLIQVGSDEVLLDDSVRMAERMRAAGCQVELEIWPRMPHAWHLWARLVPEARAAMSSSSSSAGARRRRSRECVPARQNRAQPVAVARSRCCTG